MAASSLRRWCSPSASRSRSTTRSGFKGLHNLTLPHGGQQLAAMVQRQCVQEEVQPLAAQHRVDRVLRHAHPVVRHAALQQDTLDLL